MSENTAAILILGIVVPGAGILVAAVEGCEHVAKAVAGKAEDSASLRISLAIRHAIIAALLLLVSGLVVALGVMSSCEGGS